MRSGGIVWVRDVNERGIWGDRGQHRIEVVTQLPCRNHDRSGAARLRGQRVDRERVLGIDATAARCQRRSRRQLEDVVAAIAERDPVGRHVVAHGKRRLQFEAVGIRIPAEVFYRRSHRLPG